MGRSDLGSGSVVMAGGIATTAGGIATGTGGGGGGSAQDAAISAMNASGAPRSGESVIESFLRFDAGKVLAEISSIPRCGGALQKQSALAIVLRQRRSALELGAPFVAAAEAQKEISAHRGHEVVALERRQVRQLVDDR